MAKPYRVCVEGLFFAAEQGNRADKFASVQHRHRQQCAIPKFANNFLVSALDAERLSIGHHHHAVLFDGFVHRIGDFLQQIGILIELGVVGNRHHRAVIVFEFADSDPVAVQQAGQLATQADQNLAVTILLETSRQQADD